ncbi:MAG TPA: tail fiber domain-containing protein [Pyrinomonadaceae bacterium]|nr:tail fiber domain-containing protein [Pyrinomonadaceae bacterium]
MSIRSISVSVIFSLILLAATSAVAQDQATTGVTAASSATVTAAVTEPNAIRLSSPGEISNIRLEVYAPNGTLAFDSGLRQGNVFDWKLSEATQPIGDGTYLFVVTIRDLQGKFHQRLANIVVDAGHASLTTQRSVAINAPQKQTLNTRLQSQKIAPADSTDAVTVLRPGKERSVVVTAHDGTNGQVASTSGSLTFRTGDTLTGNEKERVRITPEGNVGIGTDKPEATLDVAGEIRAKGIRFEDGSVLKSASSLPRGQTTLAAVSETPTPDALTGTGTTNRIARWMDNVGTLGDSVNLFDNGTNVGIGNSNPQSLVHIGPNNGYGATTGLLLANNLLGTQYDRAFQIAPRQTVSPSTNSIMIYALPTVNAGVNVPSQYGIVIDGKQGAGTVTSSAAIVTGQTASLGATNNTHLLLGTAGIPSGNYGIYDNTGYQNYFKGNVGINTTAPIDKLEVNGNIRISGLTNGLIFADGSKMTTAGVGGASVPSGTNIIGAINDPATVGLIADSRVSLNLARLNGTNFWSGNNAFNGLSVNNGAISNLANPVLPTDATNKFYVDTNTIRFAPTTFQLSVGDANGTFPMMWLRGGSTCCSGPGGHTPADFKIFQNGSFVATGNLGIGVSPMQGKGYRTSWDSYKGAFRSGYADSEWDDANVGFFSWAGGSNSTAVGLYALAFGDTNTAESTSSIVFGSGNQVKGAAGFSAGAGNRVCDTYGVALGNNAKSGGPFINGKCDPDSFNLRGLAAIAIGYNVTADQDHTTAMGKFASNNGFTGTFVWSDGSATASAETFRNTANNEFALRATGGFRFRTNLSGTTGCNLPAGSGVFNCTSSRTTKQNFMVVDGNDVLSRLRQVPISTWNYISEGDQSRHMGPMAEDFFSAFKLGVSDKAIGIQDLAGVNLAAIKALDERTTQLQQKQNELEQLRSQVVQLETANEAFERRLSTLENASKVETRHHRRR